MLTLITKFPLQTFPSGASPKKILEILHKIVEMRWNYNTALHRILKIRKRPYFSRLSTSWLITSFLKILLTTEKRPTGWQISAVELSLVFLITGTTDEIFQQSGKQDSLTHILKCSASMYESSDLQFFRTNSAIQYRRDVFYKWSWSWPSYPTWRLRVYYAVSY